MSASRAATSSSAQARSAVLSGTSTVPTSALLSPSASGVANSSTPASQSASGLGIQSQVPIFACVPASYNWTGGTGPYLLYIINSGLNNAPVLKTLPAEADAGTASWGCDITPGTSITFVVQDSANHTQYSSPIVMQTNSDLSCLPSTSSGTDTGAIVGGVVGGVAGLAAVLLLLWFFIIRPARRSKARGPDFYEHDGSQHDKETLQVSMPPPVTPSGPGVGTYNLQDPRIDFNPHSLDALEEVRMANAPPSYAEGPTTRPGTAARP